MSLLENYNLQLFQSDIGKKMPLTCIVGLKTNEPFREALKNIWMTLVNTYFTNVNSFTKITRWLQNSGLQLLQFDIRQKCRQRVS